MLPEMPEHIFDLVTLEMNKKEKKPLRIDFLAPFQSRKEKSDSGSFPIPNHVLEFVQWAHHIVLT